MKVIHSFGFSVGVHEVGGLVTLGRVETGECIAEQLWLASHVPFPLTLSLVE